MSLPPLRELAILPPPKPGGAGDETPSFSSPILVIAIPSPPLPPPLKFGRDAVLDPGLLRLFPLWLDRLDLVRRLLPLEAPLLPPDLPPVLIIFGLCGGVWRLFPSAGLPGAL